MFVTVPVPNTLTVATNGAPYPLMHRFSHASMISRFRWSSFLFILRHVLLAAGLLMLGHAVYVDDRDRVFWGVGVLGASLVTALLQWILAARVRCPLCMTQVLAHKSCSRHRSARTLLGSHRLRVSVTVLFRGYFRCPYCGEPTAMEVRRRRSRSHSQGH